MKSGYQQKKSHFMSRIQHNANCVSRALSKFATISRFFSSCYKHSPPPVVSEQLRKDAAVFAG